MNFYTIEDIDLVKREAYRVIELLEKEEIIFTERGKSNRILLDQYNYEILQEFLDYKERYSTLPLALSQWSKERYQEKVEELESEMVDKDRKINRLQNQLQVRRKVWYKRPLVRIRDWLDNFLG